MKLTKPNLRWLPIAALGGLILAGPIVQGAMATEQGKFKYHWGRRDMPFELEIGDNVKRTWNRYLDRSIDDWADSRAVEPVEANGSSAPAKCDNTKGRVEVCSSFYGQTGWLGLTRITFDRKNDHITSATVKINDSYFTSGKYNDPDAKRHTMCHELGHAFGLDHTDNASCMNDSESAIFNNVDPLKGDFKKLRKKYDHRDDKREVTVGRDRNGRALTGAGPTGFFDVETMPNAKTGPAGNHTKTVEALPTGEKVVTYISWIDE